MIVSVNFHFWKYDITEFHIRKGPVPSKCGFCEPKNDKMDKR